jgi:hypothetical protein
MEKITKEDYIESLKIVKEYENNIILNNGIPCFIIYDNLSIDGSKPIMVFTDEDLAIRIKELKEYSNLLHVKLYKSHKQKGHSRNLF